MNEWKAIVDGHLPDVGDLITAIIQLNNSSVFVVTCWISDEFENLYDSFGDDIGYCLSDVTHWREIGELPLNTKEAINE